MAVRAADHKLGFHRRGGLRDSLGNPTRVGQHVATGLNVVGLEPCHRIKHACTFNSQIAFIDHHDADVFGTLQEG